MAPPPPPPRPPATIPSPMYNGRAPPAPGAMRAYILRRVLLALATIWLASTMVFLALRVSPEPTAAERIASQCDLTKFEDCRRIFDKEFGLDKPLPAQYATFISDLATGDLGNSFASGREPVAGEIKRRIGTSIELGVLPGITAGIVA